MKHRKHLHRNNRRVLYVAYANPASYPPLLHSAELFAQRSWQVLMLGVTSVGTEKLVIGDNPNIECKIFGRVERGILQKLHYLGFALSVWWNVIVFKPQLLYVSDALATPIAFLLSFFINVIYHEHDSPGPAQGSRCINWLVMRSRQALAHSARMLVLPSNQRADEFKTETGVDRIVEILFNCPLRREVSLLPPKQRRTRFVLYYHGSIVPSRLPLAVIQALTVCDRVHLKIVGFETSGHVGYIAKLREESTKWGVASRFEYLGAIPDRDSMLAICNTADIGLSLMPLITPDSNEMTMAGPSNKPFDYLACGLALLVSRRPEWEAMFVQPGYARACDPEDPEDIGAQLNWLCDNPEQLSRMGHLGRARILQEWNYDVGFERIYAKLASKNA